MPSEQCPVVRLERLLAAVDPHHPLLLGRPDALRAWAMMAAQHGLNVHWIQRMFPGNHDGIWFPTEHLCARHPRDWARGSVNDEFFEVSSSGESHA